MMPNNALQELPQEMGIETVRQIFLTDDGSLPDINFDYRGAAVAADAYQLIQRHASSLASVRPNYWSKSRSCECSIKLGDNPAQLVFGGEADPFHVVFGGLTSNAGVPIPDLGVFVLGVDFVALDYRMGEHWTDAAIYGLLQLMSDLASLANGTLVSHEGNPHDSDGQILVGALNEWRSANNAMHAKTHAQPSHLP
jgi:hypothetical protein